MGSKSPEGGGAYLNLVPQTAKAQLLSSGYHLASRIQLRRINSNRDRLFRLWIAG